MKRRKHREVWKRSDLIAAAGVLVAILAILSAIIFRDDAPSEDRAKELPATADRISGGTSLPDEIALQADLEVNRALSLGNTPRPGSISSVLGWGDEVGGRPVYTYDPAPTSLNPEPGFNAWVDVPGGIGDERAFLTARVGADGQAWSNVQSGQRVARVEEGEAVWLRLYASNSTYELDNCASLEGDFVARDVRFQISVWEDPDESGRHVFRAWLMGSNTTPEWVTDAVVVYTAPGKRLEFDSTQSFYYQEILDADGSSTSPRSTLETASKPLEGDPTSAMGAPINASGLLGSCWSNRWAGMVAFTTADPQ